MVLPLLEAEVVRSGWVSHDDSLAGYGAAQGVPGPLFTFSAYLGTVLGPKPNGPVGATIALIAIFLPGFLLLVGTIPFWDAFRARPNAQALTRGANAAVVGILGAALYDPVFTSAIVNPRALGCSDRRGARWLGDRVDLAAAAADIRRNFCTPFAFSARKLTGPSGYATTSSLLS